MMKKECKKGIQKLWIYRKYVISELCDIYCCVLDMICVFTPLQLAGHGSAMGQMQASPYSAQGQSPYPQVYQPHQAPSCQNKPE